MTISKRTFSGDLFRATVSGSRTNPTVTLELQDDDVWHEESCFASFWLDELIDVLHRAREYAKENEIK